jgi:hypothetical protein
MAKRITDRGLKLGGPVWLEADDVIVETLLQVGNGVDAKFRDPMLKEQALALRQEFADLLREAAGSDQSMLYAREFEQRAIELVGGGVNVEPVSAMDGPRLRLAYDRTFRDLHAALSNGVLLLLDPQRGFGKALCVCGHCSKFYLAHRNPKGGPANRQYCSANCRSRAHDSTESRAARRRSQAATTGRAVKAARKHK